MKKLYFISLILIFLIASSSVQAATSTAERLRGQIIYTQDKPTEFWIVDSKNLKRTRISDYKQALQSFKSKFTGINEANFKKIASAGSSVKNNLELAKKFLDKIILRVEKHGAAWYVNPSNLQKYDISNSAEFFKNLPLLATKVSSAELAQIHKPGLYESIDKYSSYEYKTIKTERGSFAIDIVKIDLSDPNLKIITDTADDFSCKSNCKAKPLADYVFPAKAFAGMNGTYFCASKGCVANYYFFPVYNTAKKVMINESELKYWTTGPMMVFDKDNKFYYFKDSRDFKSVADFESKYNTTIQAAIGNKPRLVEDGQNALIEWEIDAGQLKGKYWRNAIGYQDNGTNGHGILYLVIARRATIDDLAVIMKELKMDYALNMDGGSSAALFYNDEYMEGPGRDIPNAILFAK